MTTAASTMPFKRILVPVDGSDHGFHAARTAARLARTFDAKLTLLTVYDQPSGAWASPTTRRPSTRPWSTPAP